MVGFTTTVETEWDDQEQGWMLALARFRADCCSQCGAQLEETTDPKNEDRYEHLNPLQCHRCVGLSRARAAYEDQPHPQSFLHLVRLKRR